LALPGGEVQIEPW